MTLHSQVGVRRRRPRRLLLAGTVAACLATSMAFLVQGSGAAPVDGNRSLARSLAPDREIAPAPRTVRSLAALPESSPYAPSIRLRYSRSMAAADAAPATATEGPATGPEDAAALVLEEHAFTVRRGDSLSRLFNKAGLERRDLSAMVALGRPASALSRLRPGDRVTVYADTDGRVQGLSHQRGARRLDIGRVDDEFRVGAAPRPDGAVTASRGRENSNDWVELHKPTPALASRTVSVGRGDSLYAIFKRNGFRLADLDAIVKASEDAKELRRLQPGQRIEFHLTRDNGVSKLVHFLDETRSLHIRRNGVGYDSKFVEVPLERHVATATATIESSLFLAGQRAGLSNNVIMQLVEIFGWDVDFALDIRAGDRFAVVYEELYKDGEKLRDGSIVAASFTNQGRTTRIVRYDYPDGRSAYFTPEGFSIRKAFLRAPVNARISSRFSLRRKHPVLHRFRAHRGVDYAAPRGTPIKATGDGKVEHIGWKGGYGKTIVLRHGATYTTLYAHLSRFARRLRRGDRVSQGQTIGYIGSTGLSTGPHLHYEFRVRGVHRNPLKVKLPKASPIEEDHRERFLAQTADMVAHLDFLNTPTLAADERRTTDTD